MNIFNQTQKLGAPRRNEKFQSDTRLGAPDSILRPGKAQMIALRTLLSSHGCS